MCCARCRLHVHRRDDQRATPPHLVSLSGLIPCIGVILRVLVSQFQGFICKTYCYFSVFLAENQGFEGSEPESGVTRAGADGHTLHHVGTILLLRKRPALFSFYENFLRLQATNKIAG